MKSKTKLFLPTTILLTVALAIATLTLSHIAYAQVSAPVRRVTFAWDAHPEAAELSGFRLYYGPVSNGTQTFPNVVTIPGGQTVEYPLSTTFTSGSNYSAYVTAVNTSGLESEPSNVVTFKFPSGVKNAKIKIPVVQ